MPLRPISKSAHATALTWLCAVAAILCLCMEPAEAEPVQRRLLAIYDSAREPQSSSTVVHYLAEMPLNHMGYIVDYHDLRRAPLPPVEAMAGYRAVITWFTYDLERPTEYLEWAARVAESGVRFIILGSFGGQTTNVNLQLLNRVLARIGIRYTTEYVAVTAGSGVSYRDDALIGFERPLDPVLPEFPIIRRISPDAHVALEVLAPPRSLGTPSALVTVGPGGAFVPAGFEIYYDEKINRSQWIVDPFELFRRALGEQVFPIPDTTTVSGRRLYFSHVDGDGWNNIAEMDRYSSRLVVSAEVMLRELIAPYPDLPVAVGLVAGDLDPMLGGGKEAEAIARRIFALPQVEVASHTCTHPFYWGFYEHYDRAAELALLPSPAEAEVDPGPVGRLMASLGLSRPPTEQERMRARYMSGGKELPRAYMREPFGLGVEVGHAVRATEALAPPGKSATLYQWSGDTRAFEGVIRATRRAGLRNINGGDTRLDGEYPSIGYVAPLSRVDGSERQIYAVNSNENTYTNEWTDHFHGYLSLAETLRRTEHPRRLKGVNIYYHTFSAEKQASLDAVRTHLDWARTTRLAPVMASRYAAIADGFFSTRIERIAAGSWRVSTRDGLQTLRFDDAERLDVDLARSEGVLGRTRLAGSLYIALDEAVTDATVTLRERQDDTGASSATTPALGDSRWLVRALRRDRCGIRYQASGYGAGAFAWDGFRAGRYRVEAWRGPEQVWRGAAAAGADGRLEFEVAADAINGLEIRVSCASASDGA